MRKTLAITLSTAVALMWLTYQDLSVSAQVEEEPQATQNGDVNGDGKRDIADAISLLTWMFEDGPEPVALACEEECNDIGRRVAGTYLANFDFRDGLKGFLTLTADGGLLLSTQAQYGAVTSAYQSVFHGTWKATGDHEIRADTWWLSFKNDGTFPGPRGSDVAMFRWEWRFDDGFNEVSGQMVETASWTPDLDPMEDDPSGRPPKFAMRARRISVDL